MTILPTGPATAASPLTPDTGTGPGDFLAAIEQALAAALGMPALVPAAPGLAAPASAVGSVVAKPAPVGFEAPASAVAPQPAVVGAVAAKPAPVVEPVETPVTKPGFEAPASAVAPQPAVVAQPAPVVEPVETPATRAPGFEAPAGAVAPQPAVVRSAAAKPAQVVEPVETPATKAPGFEVPAGAVAPQPPVVRTVVTKPAPVVEPAETPTAQPAQPVTAKPMAHDQPDSGPSDQPSHQAAAPAAPAPSTLPLTSAVPLPSAAPTAAPTSTTHVPATAVREQVFGEVTSLVSRGPGTHRITLTLHPEELGEVRVVMTVRDGGVHVRLAAGAEAHQALLEGSSELGRLLERAGATESRVVVREFTPVAPATSADSSQLNLSTGDRPTDQHAGTRADHPATDGADRLLTRRPPVLQEARPRQPVSGARTSGLDLTM